MLEVAKIQDHLSLVLPLLGRLVERSRPDWTVADVIQNCVSGKWTLLVDDDGPSFVLVSVSEAEYSKRRKLVVEACCHPNTERGIEDFYPLLDMLARQMGCCEITMESRRKGWERIGWTPEWITYSRPVQEVPDV